MSQHTRSEQRYLSAMASADLFNLVRDLVSQSIQAGVQPTEVWLGPFQARVLEVELNWQSIEGGLVHTNQNLSAMIRGDMEGAQPMGLRVRLMAKDGVRVGISWPNPSAGQIEPVPKA